MRENTRFPVRIFIDPSGYRWRNHGDAMMLEVALARIRAFWPAAAVTVHNLEQEPLLALDPAVEPLDPSAAVAWRVASRMPFRRVAATAALRIKRRDPKLLRTYLDAVRNADLVFVSGAGRLNDAFARDAFTLLGTLELAPRSGAVTALMGQGLGPIRNRALRRRTAAVLPRVDFLTLRERVAGPALLESLRMSPASVTVTGDDAITRAFHARADRAGDAIGINVRVADYAGVDRRTTAIVAAAVRDAARRHRAPLVPIPIDLGDLSAIRTMLADSTLGEEVPNTDALLALLPRCRVVVAGSYHAATLALSMGIPAVTIAASDYYADKFRGLAGQFGPRCRVLFASDPAFAAQLTRAIDEAWASAEDDRAPLLEAAERQIALGEAAYRRLYGIVEGRRRRAL